MKSDIIFQVNRIKPKIVACLLLSLIVFFFSFLVFDIRVDGKFFFYLPFQQIMAVWVLADAYRKCPNSIKLTTHGVSIGKKEICFKDLGKVTYLSQFVCGWEDYLVFYDKLNKPITSLSERAFENRDLFKSFVNEVEGRSKENNYIFEHPVNLTAEKERTLNKYFSLPINLVLLFSGPVLFALAVFKITNRIDPDLFIIMLLLSILGIIVSTLKNRICSVKK